MRLLATAPGGFSDFIPSVAVIDLLEIPETIEPGEYVLQYRYDSEQTPQVWNTCSGEHRPSQSASPFCAAKFQRAGAVCLLQTSRSFRGCRASPRSTSPARSRCSSQRDRPPGPLCTSTS